MDMDKEKKRFYILEKIGEGSFSRIFKAYDLMLDKEVALKVEKKNKNILKSEYEILKKLQGLAYTPNVYCYLSNINKYCYTNKHDCNGSFIVMEYLGCNVKEYVKNGADNYLNNRKISNHSTGNKLNTYEILIHMLNAIEQIHEIGIIHRDIKASKFVLSRCESDLYLIDFGLAKINYNKMFPNLNHFRTEPRGTMMCEELNDHQSNELSRRDDMFAFFFVLLELLDHKLPWVSHNVILTEEDIEKSKEIFINEPKYYLFNSECKHKHKHAVHLLEILNHLKSLNLEDKPNYNYVREKIKELKYKSYNFLFTKRIGENNKQFINKNKKFNTNNIDFDKTNNVKNYFCKLNIHMDKCLINFLMENLESIPCLKSKSIKKNEVAAKISTFK